MSFFFFYHSSDDFLKLSADADSFSATVALAIVQQYGLYMQ